VVIEAIGVEGFDGLGDALVQAAAPVHEQQTVGRLLGQRALGSVFDVAHRRSLEMNSAHYKCSLRSNSSAPETSRTRFSKFDRVTQKYGLVTTRANASLMFPLGELVPPPFSGLIWIFKRVGALAPCLPSGLSSAIGAKGPAMDVAFVVEAHPDKARVEFAPWYHYRRELAKVGIKVTLFDDLRKAWRPFDAMILMVWLDWANRELFKPELIIPVMEKFAAYRAAFAETTQVILNHTEMGRRAYATPYWRLGDPILFRTPAYDRSKLAPFPEKDIFAFEYLRGKPCFRASTIKYRAGFIGTPSGPQGYRAIVAAETAKVGIGRCVSKQIPKRDYDELMSACRIIVCPRGWGESSERHWDAWKSGKAVLTDRACASVEMVPGVRLRDKIHYLVYQDTHEIPEIVSDWTRPGRADDLEEIAANGRKAALSYDAYQQTVEFFDRLSGDVGESAG